MKKAIIILLIALVMIETSLYLNLSLILRDWIEVHLLAGGFILFGVGYWKILNRN